MNNDLINAIANRRLQTQQEASEEERPIQGFFDVRVNSNAWIKSIEDKEIKEVEEYILKELLIFKTYKNYFESKARYNFIKTGKNAGKSIHICLEIIYRIITNSHTRILVLRKEKAMLRDSTLQSFRMAFQLIKKETGINLDNKDVYFFIQDSQGHERITFKPTGQQIVFKGFNKTDIAQGLDAGIFYWDIIWFDEILEFSKNNQLPPREMMRMITYLESSCFGRKIRDDILQKMVFTLNPTVPKHLLYDKFVNPFRGKQHTIKEREKKIYQEVYNMDAFEGKGMYLLDGSVYINTKLTESYERDIRNRKKNDPEAYQNMDLGLDIAYIQDCYGKNATKLVSIDEPRKEYLGFIAGLDWGKGHDTCGNIMGYWINDKDELCIDYLDEIYFTGLLKYDDNEKIDLIVEFYKKQKDKYNIHFLEIEVDNREAFIPTAINNRIAIKDYTNIYADECYKGRINDRISRLRSLLANKRFRCINKMNNEGTNIYTSLIGELQNAYLDESGNRKGVDHRLDGIDYGIEEIEDSL